MTFYRFLIKNTERSETTLHNSAVRYSAVRCLIQAIEAASLIIKKLCHFGVVSHGNLAPLMTDTRNLKPSFSYNKLSGKTR
jgi:hypothetical protein